MATNVSFTPSKVDTAQYKSTGNIYQYLRLKIASGSNEHVTWDASTHKLSVPWAVEFRSAQYDSSTSNTSRWNVAGYYASIGGTAVVDRHATSNGSYYVKYTGYKLGQNLASGTWTKDNVVSNQSIALYVKELVNAGWSSSRWNTEGGQYGYRKGTATLVITIPEIGSPTISASITKTSASRGGSDGSAKFTLSMTAGNNATISSYSVTCNNSTQSNTNPATFSSLKNNTTYNWSAAISNNGGKTGSASGSFSLDGQVPLINSITVTRARTAATLSPNITYDTNASQSSVSVKYGTSTSYGSTATSWSLSGLSPNTTYYYSATVTDNFSKTSTAKTGSFTTTCNAPSNLVMTRASATTSSMNITLSATGDTNAAITNYKLYYRKGTSGSYTTVDYGTNTTRTISGLDSDTNYQLYFTATNAGGTSTSTTYTFSPNLNNPSISNFTITNLLPFTCTATVTASVSPSRTLNYRFSKDGGSTWTAYQASNVYNWTGLSEETTYTMAVQVKAIHTSVSASDTTATTSTVIKTPADQAKIRRMINGQWVKGKTYIKVNGSWVKAKKLYIKVNGQWKLNDNEH